ncbi:MAG: BTAD domain-containing putative transcriptional regulator [Anaerolineae bacterium]
MAALTLRLLGPPVVEAGEDRVHLPSVKAHALLYYLAVQPSHPFSRSHLCALLWENSSETEARNSLSTVLTRLRKALPVFPVAAEGDTLTWRPGDAAWVDTDAFRAAGSTLADLRAAADLWRGPLLDGFEVRDSVAYDEWLRVARAEWEGRYLDLLYRLAEQARGLREWTAARDAAQRALAVDPLQERFHRALMAALYQMGDRAAALAQYRACVETLKAQLGAAPDAETTRLFEEIRAGDLQRIAAPPAPRVAAAPRLPRPPNLPLLERQDELDALLAHAARAAQPQTSNTDASHADLRGRLVLVEGEAGIGKSRLLAELVWQLARRDEPAYTILQGVCHEAERSLPYHPIVDALNSLLPTLDAPTLPVADIWLAEVARIVPDILDTRPGILTPRQDTVQDHRRLFEGVTRLLAALPAPVLFVLDDLQWADEATARLLAYLVRHLDDHPILFVAALRTDDVDDGLKTTLWHLEREGRLSRVTLGRLSPTAMTSLIEKMAGPQDRVERLGAWLYRESAGNPLFSVEIVRSLMEAGSLLDELGDSRLPANPIKLTLPPSIVAVIGARLARVTPSARELLAAASVFRRAFEFDLAQAVSGQNEDTALDALDELLQAHLLVEEPSASGEPLYDFSHDTARQVVYRELSQARIIALHRRAVAVLGPPKDGRAAERTAYHAYLGRMWREAVTWSVLAAENAASVFAFATATLLYQQALDALERLPLDDDVKRQSVVIRLSLSRVAFYIYPGRLNEWLAPAEAAALDLGDETLQAMVGLAKGGSLYIQGHFKEARPLLEELLPLAERTGNSLLVARTVNILGRLMAFMGDLQPGLPVLAEGAARLDMVGAHNDALISQGMIGAERAYLGEFQAALEITERVWADSAKQADPAAIAAAANFLEAVYQMWGRWAEAEAWGRRAESLAQQASNIVYERNVYLFLGLPLARLGHLAAGRDALERAIELGAECRSRVFMGRAHAWLAEVLLELGDRAAALAAAETGLTIAQECGARFDEALARRVLGEALAACGKASDGLDHLRAGIAICRAHSFQPELARTLAAAGRLAHALGDARGGAAYLTEAAGLLSALDMTWDLAHLTAAP